MGDTRVHAAADNSCLNFLQKSAVNFLTHAQAYEIYCFLIYGEFLAEDFANQKYKRWMSTEPSVSCCIDKMGPVMENFKKTLFALCAVSLSGTAFAGTHTADFSGVSDLNSTASSFSFVTSDGITVDVSGWSDTEQTGSDTSATGDSKIIAADLDKFGSGWGIDNDDENCNTSNDGVCSTEHSADNFSGYSSQWHDYDMFLIEFSTEVTLTGADFSWLYDSNNSEISVAAINQALSDNLVDNTWQNVLGDAGFLWSDSFSVDSGTYEASIDAGMTASQYWLVGAYNSAFNTDFSGGSLANDGLKLSSVSFNRSSTVVPEPHMALLMLAGLIGLRRKRS